MPRTEFRLCHRLSPDFRCTAGEYAAGRLSQVGNKEMPDAESGLFNLSKREK